MEQEECANFAILVLTEHLFEFKETGDVFLSNFVFCISAIFSGIILSPFIFVIN